MKINIPRFFGKILLWISQFFNDNKFLLVCKGYNEDNDYFTGLYWRDDKDLDFFDKSYGNFQLWLMG